MVVCLDKMRPELILYLELIRDGESGKGIGVVYVDWGWRPSMFCNEKVPE